MQQRRKTIIDKLSEVTNETPEERMEKLMSLAEEHGRLARGYGETTVFLVMGADGRTLMLSVYKNGKVQFYLGYRRDANFKARKQKENIVKRLKKLGLLDRSYKIDSHSDQKTLEKNPNRDERGGIQRAPSRS